MGIFSKTSSSGANNSAQGLKEVTLKYPKPKTMLVDLPQEVFVRLSEAGFNVNKGSFGSPYKVSKSSQYQPLVGQMTLPNFSEQEVVVVDLLINGKLNSPEGERHCPEEESDIWAKCDQGFIDPRPRAAAHVIGAFDRILMSGGVFVVFADAKTNVQLFVGQVSKAYGYGQLDIQNAYPHDAWNFISDFWDMTVSAEHGYEMSSRGNDSTLLRLLSEYLPGSQFTCTLEPGYAGNYPWETIAVNKFGHAVGLCRRVANGGTVIVLPQLKKKAEFLVKLFTNVLPEIAPHLFPSIEKGKWTHRPEYELARVLELKEKQIEVRRVAQAEISRLETELQNERESNGWIHDLLTATGDQLVDAVAKALSEAGFQNIVDVDIERDKEGKSRREDLQIHDQSPLLIVDVKGIGGYPSDEDALQAGKHAMIRMREMQRTDINGLSIINHQRHLPPLERENVMPFRQELIDAAMEQSLGLMTSWDLYRLVVNCKKLGWSSADVKPIFYRNGRIEIIPNHYQYVGTIAKAWTDKFGVVLEQGELKVGDRVAIEFAIEFEETSVESILVNNKSVQHAKVNDQTGLLWPQSKSKLREGLRVFRIPAQLKS